MDNHEIARRIAALHILKAVGITDGITIKGYTVFVDGVAATAQATNRIAALKHMIVAIAGDHVQDDVVELLNNNKSHRREVAWIWDNTTGEDVLNLIGSYISMKEQ